MVQQIHDAVPLQLWDFNILSTLLAFHITIMIREGYSVIFLPGEQSTPFFYLLILIFTVNVQTDDKE